jgi:hypothetical protein
MGVEWTSIYPECPVRKGYFVSPFVLHGVEAEIRELAAEVGLRAETSEQLIQLIEAGAEELAHLPEGLREALQHLLALRADLVANPGFWARALTDKPG